MRKIWRKLREKWSLICMSILGFGIILTTINNIYRNRQYDADVEEVMDTIGAYMATATKDEYTEIAKSIRHDLVFSKYGKDLEKAVQYISNTSDKCPTCMEDYPAYAYLVCTNTGELYEMDVFDKDKRSDFKEGGYTSMDFGYDEISKSSVQITKVPDKKEASVSLNREGGIVSVQRMKSLFCDDCIGEILHTVENQLIEEFVIFDADRKMFYPIDDETPVQIGEYEVETVFRDGDYKIEIKCMDE